MAKKTYSTPYKHSIEKKGVLIFFPHKNPWKSASETVPTSSSTDVSLAIPPEAFGARSTVSGGGDFEGRPSSQWQCRSGTFRCRESRGGLLLLKHGVLVEGGEGEVLCCVFGLGGSDG